MPDTTSIDGIIRLAVYTISTGFAGAVAGYYYCRRRPKDAVDDLEAVESAVRIREAFESIRRFKDDKNRKAGLPVLLHSGQEIFCTGVVSVGKFSAVIDYRIPSIGNRYTRSYHDRGSSLDANGRALIRYSSVAFVAIPDSD